MTWVDNVGRIVQTLIGVMALVTAVTQGIPVVRQAITSYKQNKTTIGVTQVLAQIAKEVRLLDLALILMGSVFFSLLWIDALLVSGRSVTIFASAVATLVIVIGTTAALVFMWYQGKSEQSIGWWSLLTLILLVIAPGGPFVNGDVDGLPGINLWVPVLTLVFLIVTTWFYEIGHPFDATVKWQNRVYASVILVGVCLVASLSLGQQFINFIQTDRRTPNINTNAIQQSLESISNWPYQQTRTFYGITSDVQLVEAYANYSQIVSGRQVIDELITDQGSEFEQKRDDLATYFIDNHDMTEIQAREFVATIERVLDNAGSIQDISSLLSKKLNMSQESSDDLAQGILRFFGAVEVTIFRSSRLDDILSYFKSLDRTDQLSYLINRLKWIHPVGLQNQEQSPLSLPGITAQERFSTLSTRRIEHALSRQSSQVNALLAEFDYDKSIVEKFGSDSNNPTIYFEGPPRPFGPSQPELDKPTVFPELDARFFTPRLQEQLSLPLSFESHLAYKEYEVVARSLLESQLETQGLSKANIESIFNDIDQLNVRSREAFLFYLVLDETENGDNFLAVRDLGALNFDLSPFQSTDGSMAIRQMVSLIEREQKAPSNNPLAQNVEAILSIQSKSTQDNISRFLRIQNPTTPVQNLLTTNVFSVVRTIDTQLSTEQRSIFFETLRNPIQPVVAYLIDQKFFNELPENANTAFLQFKQLNLEEREGFLHQNALYLYRTEGEYSHNIFSLMVLQAASWFSSAALFVGSLLAIPFVCMVAGLGAYAARRLGARDKLREVLIAEAVTEDIEYDIGTPDELRGREDVIMQLRNLAGRGWSAIAIVGRRGVGKTRVLYELLRSHRGNQQPHAVTTWISVPSKFEEAEFIESILERVTTEVENVIARCLGAKPLEIRKLETKTTLVGLAIYITFFAILIFVFTLMTDRLASSQLISTWFPVFAIFVFSLSALLAHILGMQPINLSPWLERDRSNSPHAVLLYREALKTRDFLNARRKGNVLNSRFTSIMESLRIGVVIMTIVLISVMALGGIGSTSIDQQQAIIGLGVLILIVVLTLSRGSNMRVAHGLSLMSLILEYRHFIERVVYRIKMGALGDRPKGDFEVVICIDELDKIVDLKEMRGFLQRMKTIFEIPGAYYYLSLSEDALNALYLGIAEGKNEIDSSFDHVVRIPPLDCEVGESIAKSYLKKHLHGIEDSRLFRVIAAISFGIPRDIIRRCDEVLTSSDSTKLDPSWICDDFRRRQAMLAYGEQLISKQQLENFLSEPAAVIQDIPGYLSQNLPDLRAARVILSLWVLSLISYMTTSPEENFQKSLEQLRDIGYRIPIEPIEGLVEEVTEMQNGILSILAK